MKPIKIEVPEKEDIEIENDGIEIDLQNHTVSQKLIPGPKGEDGTTPTEEQLIALIEPMIPKLKQPKDGKSPTKTEIKEIIKEVLPEDKLIEKIVEKVPKVKGDKGDKGDTLRWADLTPYEKQVLTGPQGSNGVGVPRGGTTSQVLAKKSSKDFDTEWVTGGGGGGSVETVTGLNTDNTDPANPVVQISVDGTTITGSGTPEDPLVSVGGGGSSPVSVNGDEVPDPNFINGTYILLNVGGSDITPTLSGDVLASLLKADTAIQGDELAAVAFSGDYDDLTDKPDLSVYELLSNKSTNTSLGTSDTLYPTQKAVKTYADGLVAGLLDYRGAYDASVNTFPASGGSGTAGAVLKGDMWIISVAGTLGGTAVQIGDSVIANIDSPGQTAGNWNVLNGNISYVPEDVANKVTSISGASTDTQYPSAKLLFDQLATKQPLDATLTALAGVTTAADKLIYATGVDTFSTTDLTSAARTVLDDATVGDMVNTLGGATSTGTGGLVRTGSPALITPSIAAITVSGGVLTLPTGASDTLVSKNSTDDLANKRLLAVNGTAAAPSVALGTTNGLYLIGSNNLGVTIGGTKKVDISSTLFTIDTLRFAVFNGANENHRLDATNVGWLGKSTGAPGRIGFGGNTSPTARVHLGAGATGSSTAPLKFTSGSLQTTPEAGAVEFLTDRWYGTITTGAARKEFLLDTLAQTVTNKSIDLASNTLTTTVAQLNTAISDGNIVPEAGGTFTGDISVPDEACGSGWDGSLEVPTKNAVYDKIQTLSEWDFKYTLPSDFTVTNNSTLQDVTGFTFAAVAGEVWRVEIEGATSASNATGDIKADLVTTGTWNASDSFTLNSTAYFGSTGAFDNTKSTQCSTVSSTTAVLGSPVVNNGDTVPRPIIVSAMLKITGNGDVKFQIANNIAASGRTSTLLARAVMRARRVA